MSLFMDNQYIRLLLAAINPQEPSLIFYPPPPLQSIYYNMLIKAYNTQGKLFFPLWPGSGSKMSFSAWFFMREVMQTGFVKHLSACRVEYEKGSSVLEPDVLWWRGRSIHELDVSALWVFGLSCMWMVNEDSQKAGSGFSQVSGFLWYLSVWHWFCLFLQ